jgi:4-methyl-5(b-hydroxyethyl)-thiazole monophosphate biosynthesis
MSIKTALVPIANGSEDIESVTLIDVLRRAGVEVTVASVEKDIAVTCARRTRLVADTLFADVAGKEFDLIALPGGMPGAERLRDTAALIDMLKHQDGRGALIGAICAAPGVVLGAHGLVGLRIVTVYPGFEHLLPAGAAQNADVVRGGNLVTGRGPAAAMAFSLTLVEALCGREKAAQVAAGMLATL